MRRLRSKARHYLWGVEDGFQKEPVNVVPPYEHITAKIDKIVAEAWHLNNDNRKPDVPVAHLYMHRDGTIDVHPSVGRSDAINYPTAGEEQGRDFWHVYYEGKDSMNNDSPKQKINASMDTDPWLKNPDGTMYAAPGTCEFVIYPTGYTAQELQANGEQAIRTFLGTDGKHLATVWKGQAVAVRDDYEKAGQTTYLFRQEWIVTYGEVVGP